ncbi:MAG: hypothetical protein ACO23G_10755 [Limnohabitans sp.]
MPDREISKLPELPLASLQATDPLAIADLSASETKKITAKSLVQASLSLVDDASIPLIKVDTTASGVLPGSSLTDRSVAGVKLQLDTVTAAEIAAGAVTGGPAGEIALGTITSDNIASIAGGKLDASTVTARELGPGAVAGSATTSGKVHIEAGSIGTTDIAANAVTANELADNAVDTGSVIDGAITSAKLAGGIAASKLADTTGPGQVLAGPSGAAGAVTARALVGTDLPVAMIGARGAVEPGAGLQMSGNAIGLDMTITPSVGRSVVEYDQYGRVTAGGPIELADLPTLTSAVLPLATNADVGAVSVPGPGLQVDGAGALTHALSGATAGTYTKVTINQYGHVTTGNLLNGADIPPISADKLTSGELDIARIADRSLTAIKFANYATTLIQEAVPPGFDYYTGQFWYRESDAQLRVWSGNSFIPVGFGRLSQENLRFCGTFDAATELIDQITAFGNQAGMVAGAAVPTATDALTGAYLVATTPGTFNGQVYDNGDWTLCLGATQGWSRVDTLNGTGTTTIKLSDLLDTTITTPANGDTLIFDAGTNKWINKPTAAQKASFTGAFDGVRTSYTLTRDAGSVNSLLISIGGILQEPGVDFTFTAPRTVNFPTPPPVGSDYWILVEGVASTGGGGGGGGGTTLPDGTAAEEFLGWVPGSSSWQPKDTLDGGLY